LGRYLKYESLDLDAMSIADKVLEALRIVTPIRTTWYQIWARYDKRCADLAYLLRKQIASSKLSRLTSSLITRIPVRWIMCRSKTHLLEWCIKCHMIDHNLTSCKALDKTGACWRCGEMGHAIKECKKTDDNFLTWEMAGLTKVSQAPDSVADTYRKFAVGPKTTPIDC